MLTTWTFFNFYFLKFIGVCPCSHKWERGKEKKRKREKEREREREWESQAGWALSAQSPTWGLISLTKRSWLEPKSRVRHLPLGLLFQDHLYSYNLLITNILHYFRNTLITLALILSLAGSLLGTISFISQLSHSWDLYLDWFLMIES